MKTPTAPSPSPMPRNRDVWMRVGEEQQWGPGPSCRGQDGMYATACWSPAVQALGRGPRAPTQPAPCAPCRPRGQCTLRLPRPKLTLHFSPEGDRDKSLFLLMSQNIKERAPSNQQSKTDPRASAFLLSRLFFENNLVTWGGMMGTPG